MVERRPLALPTDRAGEVNAAAMLLEAASMQTLTTTRIADYDRRRCGAPSCFADHGDERETAQQERLRFDAETVTAFLRWEADDLGGNRLSKRAHATWARAHPPAPTPATVAARFDSWNDAVATMGAVAPARRLEDSFPR